MQVVGRDLPGFAVIRALRLVRMFRLLSFFKGPFDLITAAFLDCFTTLTTILFLVVLAGAIASALILAVEAQHTNSLTQVRITCLTHHLCTLLTSTMFISAGKTCMSNWPLLRLCGCALHNTCEIK
jgi:hypothetical protein